MVRSNRRKGLEEVYGSKLDAIHPAKSQVMQHGMTKTASMRVERGGGLSQRQQDGRTQRSYVTPNDYYITTNLPLTATNMRSTSAMMGGTQPVTVLPSPYGGLTRRACGGGVTAVTTATKGTARQSSAVAKKQFPQRSDSKLPAPGGMPYNLNANKSKDMAAHMHNHGIYGQSSKPPAPRVSFGGHNTNPCTDFSDKELQLPVNATNTARCAHQHAPMQHQLHQQQQMLHPPELQPPPPPHQHKHMRGHHSKHHVSHATEDEKEDDPEEFFELIRQTVQTAIGNTVSDTLARHFRELGSKLDRFSNELKLTNEHLGQIQDQVTGKIVHYGEENSRHFRYLCMKSEYDKMFYQHHTMLANKQSSSDSPNESKLQLENEELNSKGPVYNAPYPNTFRHSKAQPIPSQRCSSSHAKPTSNSKSNLNPMQLRGSGNKGKPDNNDCSQAQNPCAYRNTSKPALQKSEPHKSSSNGSVHMNNSELAMREVVGQLQRFCAQAQKTDLKSDNNSQYMSNELLSNLESILTTTSNAGGIAPTANNSTSAATMDHLPGPSGSGKSRMAAAMQQELDTPCESMDEAFTEMEDYMSNSDDDMSLHSDDSDIKYHNGGMTSRAPLAMPNVRMPNKGAGDWQ